MIIPLSYILIKYDFSMEIFRSKNQQVMILRNPSSQRDSLFTTSTLVLFFVSHSIFSQGVIGAVKEKVTNQPIAEAVVSILKGDSVMTSFITNDEGHYEYISTNAERVRMKIQALGYAPLTTEDILLDGYSTFRFEHFLEINAFHLDSVTVKAMKPEIIYGHEISKEDLITTAANFDDPVRVGHSEPGIVLLNDQSNQFSSRGKSPVFNTWYLEGLEVVNPNHTSNAGTLSDLPTQYGGGVNMFSAQTLSSTALAQ